MGWNDQKERSSVIPTGGWAGSDGLSWLRRQSRTGGWRSPPQKASYPSGHFARFHLPEQKTLFPVFRHECRAFPLNQQVAQPDIEASLFLSPLRHGNPEAVGLQDGTDVLFKRRRRRGLRERCAGEDHGAQKGTAGACEHSVSTHASRRISLHHAAGLPIRDPLFAAILVVHQLIGVESEQVQQGGVIIIWG